MLGQRASDRSGDTWAQALAAWPNLTDVAADGGSGIERGLELVRAARDTAARETAANTADVSVVSAAQATPVKPLRARLDTFHVGRDGARALRVEWSQAEAVWEKAEKLERA